MKKSSRTSSEPILPRIGVVALSSCVPRIEFERGIETLRSHGWHVEVHPAVSGQHYFYPASDEARAQALLDFAYRKDLNTIWCARGGYGITHLLPILDRLTRKKKPPQKTLLGFSDVTALHEYVRKNWGWKTIHAPMPSLKTFAELSVAEKKSYQSLLFASLSKKGELPEGSESVHTHYLEWISAKPKTKKVTAPLVGGNLAVWLALVGTKYFARASGKILFFEEIGENLGRINRYLHQLEQAGGFKGAKAIVLGDFTDCKDTVPMRIDPTDPELRRQIPLRAQYPDEEGLWYVFGELAKRTGVPIAIGVPAGHGTQHASLWLGHSYSLQADGKFELKT